MEGNEQYCLGGFPAPLKTACEESLYSILALEDGAQCISLRTVVVFFFFFLLEHFRNSL